MLSVNIMQCFFLVIFKRKSVRQVKKLQAQYILGVTGPKRPLTFWISIEAWGGYLWDAFKWYSSSEDLLGNT